MSLKITTLIENTPGEHLGLKTEHGISFFIETDKCSLLFDTGESDSFIYNSRLLNIDLKKTDYVVLSHGHYDHSGGLRSLVEITDEFKLFVGKGFFTEKYAVLNNSCEFLGNDFDENYLEEKNIDYSVLDNQVNQISESVYIITSFNRIHKDEVINPRFKIRTAAGFEQDDFSDEVMIAVDTPEGLVIVLGCSHPGVKNMIDTATSALKKPVHAVIGGTHLVESHGESLKKSLEYLMDGIKIIGVSHCTGKDAMSELSGAGSRYFHNRTGSALFVE